MAEKKFKGAPFGVQSARFDVSGVHPTNKKTGTYTEISYCKKSTNEMERKLGPGTYDPETGDFSPRAVWQRTRGPGWKKAQETSRLSQMPLLLYRDVWGEKSFLKTKVGPGSYKICDFIELQKKRPSSKRGVCEAREERFKNHLQSWTPGPGSYGKGGIPWAVLEEKKSQSVGTYPPMDFNYGVKRFEERTVGCNLGPGTYHLKSSIDLLLGHRVSKRGPYDLFTGRRDRPATCGYFAELKKANLDPGEYSSGVKTLVEGLERKEKKKHGVFSTLPQYPAVPTDRIFLNSLSLCPRPATFPGPGWYDMVLTSQPQNQKPSPFLSSAPRVNSRTEKLQNGNYNTAGPGRYDIRNRQWNKTARGYCSVFNSQTERFLHNPDRDNYYRERLRSINIPAEKRSFIVLPEKPYGVISPCNAALA
ncbi:ciliary microtubule-associated protein 2 isoform X1 [Lepisosteus oculatus]|uniref:ciliary microtubule-associated protein 2 isoform X1 n=1 Tax=Lepisosteus oculatus TaxID=7918 RepID=UPI00371A0745